MTNDTYGFFGETYTNGQGSIDVPCWGSDPTHRGKTLTGVNIEIWSKPDIDCGIESTDVCGVGTVERTLAIDSVEGIVVISGAGLLVDAIDCGVTKYNIDCQFDNALDYGGNSGEKKQVRDPVTAYNDDVDLDSTYTNWDDFLGTGTWNIDYFAGLVKTLHCPDVYSFGGNTNNISMADFVDGTIDIVVTYSWT